jgi:hypothetical protein
MKKNFASLFLLLAAQIFLCGCMMDLYPEKWTADSVPQITDKSLLRSGLLLYDPSAERTAVEKSTSSVPVLQPAGQNYHDKNPDILIENVQKTTTQSEVKAEISEMKPPADNGENLAEVVGWKRASWGGAATVSQIGDENAAKSLKIVPTAKADKVAVVLSNPRNSFNASGLTMDIVNNSGKEVSVAFAVTIGEKGTYHEFEPFRLSQGLNRDQKAIFAQPRWKTEENGWEYRSPVSLTGGIREIIILVYEPLTNVPVEFTSIRFLREAAGEDAQFTKIRR